MAATVAGAALTEQHRKAQLRLRASFLRELTKLWPLLDVEQLDETAAEWIHVVAELILRWRRASADRALSYYEAFRRAETGQELPQPETYVGLDVPSLPAIRTSLAVTGPIGFKSALARGLTPTRARTLSFTSVAGAASRHVLNGGRSQLVQTATVDEMAVRFSRVTDGDPCAFCAMLASRGAKYLSRATGFRTTERSKRGPGKEYHDHCGCQVEPSFSVDSPGPQRNKAFAQLWADSTEGLSGKAARNAFRRAYDAQRLGA